MSQYSEMMGSFIRTGSYPLEADYIFNSELELKNFYSNELNNTLLHKGLLKIVSSGNLLILYWIISIDGELLFKPLIAGNSLEDLTNKITELRNSLNEEISLRELAIIDILGTTDKSEFQNELDNLLSISNAVVSLQKLVTKNSKDIKAIVGYELETIQEYLESLDYGNLTELSLLLHKFFDTIDDSDEKINTFPELQEFLKGFTYTHTLYDNFRDLWNEIQGTPTPNDEFRTLRGILDFVLSLASICRHNDDNLLSEINLTQIGVGLDSNGLFSPDLETNYLKNATSVMNALKTLDSLIDLAINNCNLISANTDSIDISITKETDKNTIKADVKVDPFGDITINNNGLYHKIDTEYNEGILTIKVNGNIKLQHVLGLSAIVESAHYDADLESLIITFKLHDGNSLKITVPVSKLISEWVVDNSLPDKVVELTKLRIEAGGADKLSADVRISSAAHNLLSKRGNALYVNGTSSAITHNGLALDTVITDIESNISATSDKLSEEITERKSNDEDIKNQINTLDIKVNDFVSTGVVLEIRVNGVTLNISDGTVNITVPTKVLDLTDGGNYLTKDLMDWYEG